jgi:Domain of unknown function (DUF4407)
MLQNFFITCSGANIKILKDCPPTEKTKYVGIGATVFFTAIMAAASGMFFIAFAFTNSETAVIEISNEVILIFGILWGLLIFNIDRNLIISLRKTGDWKSEFRQARLRLILAIFIGLVISTPLELKLFNTEVNRKMASENSQEKDSKIAEKYAKQAIKISTLDSTIRMIQKDVNAKEERKNNLYNIYIKEAEGTGGTMVPGRGPVFGEKKQESEAADSAYNMEKQKLDNKKLERDALTKQINKEIEDEGKSIINGNGVSTRISALYRSSWAHWFITILFIIIEILPIFTKIISKRGPYDYLLESQEHKVFVEEQLKISSLNDTANNDIEVIMFSNEKKRELNKKLEELRVEKEHNNNIELLDEIVDKQKILSKKELEKWFKEEIIKE